MSALSMDELAQAVKLGGKYITEQVGLCLVGLHCCPELTPFALQVSFRDILVMSYEGGGVYPTLVGYVLGAVATLFVARCSSWVSSLIPTTLCVVLFLHTYAGLERKSLEWLLMAAAATGVCCTYVQLASLDLIQEHFAFKKLSKAKTKND
jgi:hypothetical protein